jgi:hypothetical protein
VATFRLGGKVQEAIINTARQASTGLRNGCLNRCFRSDFMARMTQTADAIRCPDRMGSLPSTASRADDGIPPPEGRRKGTERGRGFLISNVFVNYWN